MHNESPPVKIEGILNRAAKPLPQHVRSPLTTQLSARQVSSDISNAAPVRRETVEMDPLLMSVGTTQGLGADEPGNKFLPPPLPPKPVMTSTTPNFPSSFPGSLTPTTATPPPAGYARVPVSSQLPAANSSNSLQSLSSTPSASPPPSSSFQDEVAAFLSNCRTIPLYPSAVPATPSGLQTFARASAWQYVVTLSAQLMQEQGPYSDRNQGHIPTVLKLRLEGLFRMKMFDELTAEAGQILDVELERQRLGGGERSFDLSNAMRLLLAEVLSMTGRGDEAATQLHALQHHLAQSAEPSAAFWSWKTRQCLVNAAVRQRQWRAAMSLLMDMLGEIRRAKEGSGPSVEDATRAEIVLLCRLSRTMLQLGAIRAGVGFCRQAEERFAALVRERDDIGHHVELARGLVMFSQDQDALHTFGAIAAREQSRQTSETFDVLSPERAGITSDMISNRLPFLPGIELEESLLSVAVNNLAVAALHLRKMTLSVSRLEKLILDDPVRYLTDAVVFNLCTLYELSCSPEVSTAKKRVLQRVASVFLVDDPILNYKSLRLA